ncbi:MAG TPA: hypothetical protein VGN47_14785 [Blastococcus sp.]|jgi:hypothetical protein|nr:hypothetical protein [Blastococcus sp.]
MTEHGPRTAATRDVPPPRPVPSTPSAPPSAPAEEGTLGRAARALAEAVGGFLGGGGAAEPDAADRDRAAGGPADGPSPAGDRGRGAALGDLLAAAAPRLPIRDAERLRRAHPGATDAEIAEALIARAARMTAGIGAAVGGLAAGQWLLPASLLALPLELGAETALIGAVEVVLVGELHELYGRAAPGDARSRVGAYLASWSAQRSVDAAAPAGLGALLGGAGLQALRRRVTRKVAGAVPTAAPFLLGAALSGRGNRRATQTLAERVLADLRGAGPAGPEV